MTVISNPRPIEKVSFLHCLRVANIAARSGYPAWISSLDVRGFANDLPLHIGVQKLEVYRFSGVWPIGRMLLTTHPCDRQKVGRMVGGIEYLNAILMHLVE
jgi:hypothetical protein